MKYLPVPVTVPMYVYDADFVAGGKCLPTIDAIEEEIFTMQGILDGLVQADPERVLAVLVPLDPEGEPVAWNLYITPTRTITPDECSQPPVVGFSVEEVRDQIQAKARESLLWLNGMLAKRKA